MSPAHVVIPLPASPLSAHLLGKPTSNKAKIARCIRSLPKDPNCAVCRRTKVTRAPCGRNPDDQSDSIKFADRFGDMRTTNHKVLHEEQESRLHHRYAVVVQDLTTQWIQSYPCKTKPAPETQRSVRKYHVQKKLHDPFVLTILKVFVYSLRRADLES